MDAKGKQKKRPFALRAINLHCKKSKSDGEKMRNTSIHKHTGGNPAEKFNSKKLTDEQVQLV